jgi:hypothetical protein
VSDLPNAPKAADENQQRENQIFFDILMAVADEIGPGMPDDVTSDHSWLYDDETGLPSMNGFVSRSRVPVAIARDRTSSAPYFYHVDLTFYRVVGWARN